MHGNSTRFAMAFFWERSLHIEYTPVLALTFGCFTSLLLVAVVNKHPSTHGALQSDNYSSGLFR